MTDTLIVDSLRLAQWRTQPEYGYDSEFKGSDFSLMEIGRASCRERV